MGQPEVLGLVLPVADFRAGVGHLLTAARIAEEVQHLRVRGDVYVAFPYLAGEPRGLRAEPGDEYRRRLVGDRVDAGILYRVVLSVVALRAAFPEEPHHLDRLFEHLQAHVGRGPAVAQDMLVQVLAGADAEVKPAFEHHGGGGSGLGEYGGVYSHGGTGYGGWWFNVG